ncbi:hypothetical protein [Chryseosolibacter indicus]|uniref:Wadjet protein JetD C-terminal domain-containing protein n=1 Tax=Chryseosolibacter indicus TaxID=2782351 RepID=A0ABS5VYF4_9BACT|nr:hypothetical protein [Chryseosolibacter indicus]MBT1705877.1 hypothetical protein [Chryseosolibacter indicus]
MNWQAIKQLNLLFKNGSVPADILKFPFVKRMVDMDYIRQTDNKTLSKSKSYDPFYANTLLPKFLQYEEFINRFEFDSLNLDETDIEILLKIEANRDVIVNEGRSQKEISASYFGGAKKLRRNSRIYDAVVKILGVKTLARDEHDQQYLYVLHCESLKPRCIVLCENDNKLRKPRLKDVELWHAGGRNTAKLKFIPKPKLPLYYLCDWDNKGIEIYQDIKANIFPDIELLIPQNPFQTSDIESPWTVQIKHTLFSPEALAILDSLMPEKWIEEENIVHPIFTQN